MSAGRRRFLLPLGFLALAFLVVGSAHAQQKPHDIWSSSLTPEQVKAALAKLGQGGDDGEANPFQEQIERLLKDRMSKEGKHSPEDIEKALKLLKDNPKLMDLAKQMAKDRQVDPGRPGKLTQDDLGKMFKIGPKGVEPGPGVAPPPGANTPPGMGETPPVPPNVGAPPKAGRAPEVSIPDPGPNPMPPPEGGANPPRPPGQPRPPSVDENPFPEPPDGDSRSKSLQAFASVWERNIGPLDETPEVKRALFDIVSGNGLDFDLKDGSGKSIWDMLNKGDGEGSFGEFLKGGEGGSWKFPQLEFPKLGSWTSSWFGGGGGGNGGGGGGSSLPRLPRTGSSGSGGGGFGGLNFAGSWTPVILLGLVIVGILLYTWLRKVRLGSGPGAAYAPEGLGPWPVDPRSINTREDVVKAFEYLSVLICGPSAKTWTHNTIADALSELATTHGETAVMLARLYELARYAPLDELLTHEELVEARQLVCGLAGVSY